MDLERRIYLMGKPIIALVAWTAIASLWAIATSLGGVADGDTFAYSRVAIGLVGIAAAALLLSGRNNGRDGWMATMLWSVLQVPYYATESGGNYTKQLIDGLLGASSSVTVNGEVTNYEAFGINLVGLVLVICTYAARNRLDLWRRRAAAPAT